MPQKLRTEKVYKGPLVGEVVKNYHTPVTKKKLKGLLIIANGGVEVIMYNGYDVIFSYDGSPTADKIATMENKIHSVNYPARGNNFKFVINPTGATPATTVSVYAATQ